MNRNLVVYDLECWNNFFMYCDKNIDTGEENTFMLFEDDDYFEMEDMIDHINNDVKGMISFNGLSYDNPLLHYIFTRNGKVGTYELYEESQRIIGEEWPDIPEYQWFKPQLDIFRLHHFKNPAKRNSLKDIAITLRHDRVQDLPKHFTDSVSADEIPDIIEYCKNDIYITEKLYKESIPAIELRKSISKMYGLKGAINYDDAKLGAELLLHFISKTTGEDKRQIKERRTYRDSIKLNDCIPPYVQFKSNEFNNLLLELRSKTITETKNALKYSVNYKGIRYDFGTGGLHASAEPGVYEDEVIISQDVISYYPNIAIKQRVYPEHLSDTFCDVYEWMFKERKKYPKSDPANYAMKIALNGSFGKLNNQYSYLYDPQALIKITLSGQLSLAMLCERFVDTGFNILLANTDGVECIVPKDKLELHAEICKEWERLTQFELEYNTYKKLILRDVNNYIAVDKDDKVKQKGCFEVEKAIHKDPSARIIPIALQEYFVNRVPVDKIIRQHQDVFDFFIRSKTNRGWKHKIINTKGEQSQQKTIRYLWTNKGSTLIKEHEDGRRIGVCVGKYVSLYNDYEEKPIYKYDINYQTYISEVRKIIKQVEGSKQHKLF